MTENVTARKAVGSERAHRICFVLESAHMAFDHRPRIGGAEMQIRIVAEELAARGHDVSVASSEGFEHARIRSESCRHLWRSWRRNRPEVVVATISTRTSVQAAVVARLLGIDYVYRLSNTGESEIRIDRAGGGNLLYRGVFYGMLRFLATRIWCQHTVQEANLARRGLGRKVFVAGNVAPDRELPAVDRETVLWVGRYDGVKRPELFLEIVRRLPERRCVMIIPGAPHAFRESAAELANLRLIDFVPPEELPAYYARARVLVNTSRTEGMPNTFIEAACQGTPIVTNRVDPGDFFARYGHGMVIEDPVALARKIDEMFGESTGYAELSRNARRYFEDVHEIGGNFPRLTRRLFAER